MQLGTSETGRCNRTIGFRGSLTTAKPASFDGGGGITAFTIFTGLTLERGRDGLVKRFLAVKDIVKTNPELLELDGLFLGEVSKTTING
jgi:hypothetical protein